MNEQDKNMLRGLYRGLNEIEQQEAERYIVPFDPTSVQDDSDSGQTSNQETKTLIGLYRGLNEIEQKEAEQYVMPFNPQSVRELETKPATAQTQSKKGNFHGLKPWTLRNRVLTGIGSTAALVMITVLIGTIWDRSGNNPILAQSVDVMSHDPIEALDRESLPKRKHLSPDEHIMKPEDNKENVIFRRSHSQSLKYQWLLHVSNSTAKIVASARQNESLVYKLIQLDSDWGQRDSRFEFLIIVTANTPLPSWPETVTQSIEVSNLFTKDELDQLQRHMLLSPQQKREDGVKQTLRTVLDRKFATNPCWFNVFSYQSEK